MLLAVLKVFGNYAGIVLFSLNYAVRALNYAAWFLSKIKAEHRVHSSV